MLLTASTRASANGVIFSTLRKTLRKPPLNKPFTRDFSHSSGSHKQGLSNQQNIFSLGKDQLTQETLTKITKGTVSLSVSSPVKERLALVGECISHCQKNGHVIYGLTTGFASLRNTPVSPEEANKLSEHIIRSHDAGIGEIIDQDITKRAMILAAQKLAKGHSGFTIEGLKTLVEMIKANIISDVCEFGSLGASGDLAPLARVGMAMMGDKNTPVSYNGEKMSAYEALQKAGIAPWEPKAKEGLALTNGTHFTAAGLSFAIDKLDSMVNKFMELQKLYLVLVNANPDAFSIEVNEVRNNPNQIRVARELREVFVGFDQTDQPPDIQNDYDIRCAPQALAPFFAQIEWSRAVLEHELNAVTDNPIIFLNQEIENKNGAFLFTDKKGIVHEAKVLSGGNFHAGPIAAKLANLTVQITQLGHLLDAQAQYILDPKNNHGFPAYLTPNPGLNSGFMILQYTMASLLSLVQNPSLPYLSNQVSGNRSEDVTSLGWTQFLSLKATIDKINQMMTIYTTILIQAWHLKDHTNISKDHPIRIVMEKLTTDLNSQLPIKNDKDMQLSDIYNVVEINLESLVCRSKDSNSSRTKTFPQK